MIKLKIRKIYGQRHILINIPYHTDLKHIKGILWSIKVYTAEGGC
jgi:hypothetical protein